MLEGIRKRRNSLLVILALGAIILVFMFWGIGPTGNNKNNQDIVATVNGSPILMRDYAAVYKRQMEYYRDMFKGQFNDDLAEKLNVKKNALDSLINRTLVLNAADEEGVSASSQEVQQAVMTIAAFQKNGVFDKEQYFQVLDANRIKPGDFEHSIAQDIVASKMRDHVVSGITVTDADVKDAYMKDNRKVALNYVAYDADVLAKGITVTDDEAREYLKNNGSNFMVPKKVKAFYAYADYNELASKTAVSADEIKQYYDKNKAQFETPEEVKARHILIRPDANLPDRAMAEDSAERKAEDVLGRLKKGEDFASLARKFSEDPGSAKQGGELDWFPKGVMIKPFEETAFSLKKGELSGVVKTSFGYHIIQVEDKKPAGMKSLKDSTPQIRKILSWQKGQTRAREIMKSLEKPFAEAKTSAQLKAAVEGKDVHSAETPLFSEKDDKVVLATNEELRDAVFYMRPGEVSGSLDTGAGMYIISLLDRVESHVPEYKDAAAEVKAALVQKKSIEEGLKKADAFLEAVKGGSDFAALARKDGLKIGSTGYFSKTEGTAPGIGVFLADKPAVFELTEKDPVYKDVVPYQSQFFVFSFKGAKDADPAGLRESAKEIHDRILNERQEAATKAWVDGLREKAEIKIKEGLI